MRSFGCVSGVSDTRRRTLVRMVACVTVLAVWGGHVAAGAALASSEPAGDGADVRPAAAGATPLRVVMFYSKTCGACKEEKQALAACKKRWGDRVAIELCNLYEMADFHRLILYENHYGSNESKVPKVFVGDQYLAGSKAIIRGVAKVVAGELDKGSRTFVPPKPRGGQVDSREAIASRFRNLRIWVVALAGLVDGVNPCAFTTIVFLLSMLAYLGRSKRQLAGVGIGFTTAVFVTYFLLGVGLLEAIKAFSVDHGISTGLAYGAAVLAFALAGWSLVDFIRYKWSGDVKTVTLGLPKSIKSRIHKVIRVGLSNWGLILGSVVVGFLVSLLESVCTGQVYLPTIILVRRAPGMRANAIAYLLLYNLMFIAPLVAILMIAYFGVRSQRLGEFLRRHLAALKLALAIVFASLGAFVLATI